MRLDRPALDAWVEQGEAGLLSVVIPARNEEGHLPTTLRALATTLDAAGIRHEIVVVDDGSTDRTVDVVEALQTEIPGARVVRNTPPHGYGYAVRAGLSAFRGDAVAIVMADASDDPNDLVAYYRKYQEGVDCVFGSRFVRGGRALDYPLPKYLLNRLSNTFIRLLFLLRYNDITNAFKLFGRHVIAGLQPLLSCHFNLTVELPLKSIVRGYTYAVIPNTWQNRVEGISKFKIREMGSRYLFIVFYCWLEQQLGRGDYVRPDGVAAAAAERGPFRHPFGPGRIALTALLGLLLAAFVPDLRQAGVPFDNLDGSWRAIFDHYAFSTAQYGRDLVYTLGPLGFLRYSIGAPGTIWYVFLWGLLLAATMASTFVLLFGRTSWPVFLTAWAAIAITPFFANLPGDYLFPLIAFLAFIQLRKDQPRPAAAELLIVAVLAIGSWVLFTYLVAAVAGLALAGLLAWVRFKRVPWHLALYVPVLAAVYAGMHQSMGTLADYVHYSREITRGYADVMTLPGPFWEIAAAIGIFAGILALLSGLRHRWSIGPALVLAAGIGAMWLFTFKSSFARHDGRRPMLVLLLMLAAVIGYMAEADAWGRLRNQVLRRRFLTPMLLAAIVAAALGRQIGFSHLTGGMRAFYAEQRVRLTAGPALLFTPGAAERVQEAYKAASRERVPLPPIAGSVDWFGDAPAILLAYPVDYRPRPTLQNFVAYTPDLAELNARYYRGPQAPDHVIVDLQSFSGTPTMALDARAAMELVRRYRHVDTLAGGRLLLDRREVPRRISRTLVLTRTLEIGELLDIAAFTHSSAIWVEIEVPTTLAGRAMDGLFKLEPLALRLQMHNGPTHSLRFPAVAAAGGFLLSPLVMNNEQFASFMADPAAVPRWSRVAALGVDATAPFTTVFRGSVTIRIYMLSFRDADTPPMSAP